MKKPFLNPVFRFLNLDYDDGSWVRMGFALEIVSPQDYLEDFPEAQMGYTLVGVKEEPRLLALYAKPLTPFAEELLALGLRYMRTAEYATLAKRPTRQRDWMGEYVQLKRKVSNENAVFPAGSIMKVVGSYRGLSLETVELYKPSGVFVKHRISKVPVDWVDLVVVPFEVGNE